MATSYPELAEGLATLPTARTSNAVNDAFTISDDEAWAAFREQIPLTDAEAQTIAGNVAPYLR